MVHDVFKLADIALPRVVHEHVFSACAQCGGAVLQPLPVGLKEMSGQRQDVPLAFAQRLQHQADHV